MKKYNKSMEEKKEMKGITIIALVITIIVLLILAGVTIRLIIGNEGLVEKAQKTGTAYSEQEAREKLEIALADLRIGKYSDSSYNSGEYIDKNLEKQEMTVIGDIVIVNDWKFEIDRSVPKIGNSLGKGTQNENIKISAEAKIREDYVNANILGNIAYDGTISEIIVNGELIEVPEKVDGAYVINKEITENGIYTIYAKDENGNYKIAKVEVTDITEDMDIWNRQDMENFRDKVNSGRTFEGRTVRVMANIDLEGSEENQWIAIGKEDKKFWGTFEGNYHAIENLYIKSNNQRSQGLFAEIGSATIQNLVMKNVYVYNDWDYCYAQGDGPISGGIVGCAREVGAKIYNCGIESGEIISVKTTLVNNLITYAQVAGIMGYGENVQIYNSYNKANIIARASKVTTNNFNAGMGAGIAGATQASKLENCYNMGNVTAEGRGIYIGGISPYLHEGGLVKNCYNVGKMSTSGTTMGVGEIIGKANTGSTQINNYTQLTTAQSLADKVWIEDEHQLNKGYPIFHWQLKYYNF